MTAGTALAQRWEITAHRSGEVSATSEHAPGLELWLLGLPRGSSESEVRGWLHDVAGVAVEAAHGATSDPAIPTLLHHALTGLLFSHAEVWERPGEPAPCSVVYTTSDDEIGFGWVGEAQVEVTLDGEAVPTRWIVVRDSTGREARAFRTQAGHDLAMRLSWVADAHDPGSPMMVLEARWPAGGARDGDAPSAVADVEAAPEPVDTNVHAEPMPEAIEELLAHEQALAVPTPDAALMNESVAASDRGDATTDSAVAPEAASAPMADVAHALEPEVLAASEPEVASAPEVASEPAGPAAPAEPPSSGIARWLQKNFSWFGHARATTLEPTAAGPAAVSEPAPVEPPAEQLPLGFAADAVVESHVLPDAEAVSPPPTSEWSTEVVAWSAPEAALEATASAEPVHDTLPETPVAATPVLESEATPAIRRSHEDEVAASAAALAAAISGIGAGVDAAAPAWRDTAPVAPEQVFEQLPDRIPPTPEPAALTARAEGATPVEPHVVELRERASATPRMPERAPNDPPPPAGPPRLEVTPRPLLRRPGEPAPPGSGYEIHARALEAPPAEASPRAKEPLIIERVGIEPTSLASPPPPVAAPPSPVVPAADPAEWVSRFKRPQPVFDPDVYAGTEAGGPTDEASLLEAARRDEWKALHAANVTPPATPAAASPAASEAAPVATAVPAPSAAPVDREPPAHTRRVPVQHPAWPEVNEIEGPRGFDRRWVWAAAIVAVLFGVGWLVGAVQSPGARPGEDTRKGPLAALLTTLGFHGPHYKVAVASRPDGALIKLDGVDLQQRTPANLELAPGHHVVALSFGPQWGENEYPLDGKKGDELAVDGTLWGAIEIASPDPGAVIAVSLDDRPRGFAPLKIDSLAPGPHQVRFSGPGMASWGQTVEVKVGEQKQILTRALSSPSTGVLQIRATANIDGEPGEVKGARVFLDGKPHGVTPQSLELPRGPHSVRLDYHGESSVVQVIDLPGGNQRYANFEIGTGVEPPKFKLDAPARFPAGEPVVVSATFDGVPAADVREMWLHVRGADGTWERFALSRLDTHLSAAGAVGAITFPIASFDPQGRTQWYVSVTSAQGDEFFTELQDAVLDKPKH